MSIIVKDKETGQEIEFPMMPDEITTQSAQSFISFQIINLGEVKIPSGEELMQFSWSGILPGESRRNSPYVGNWTSPQSLLGTFSEWRSSHHKLRLTISDTPIDHDVLLDRYTCSQTGGCGDYSYSISFIQAKDVIVNSTAAPAGAAPPKAATSKPNNGTKPKTYTVVKNDSPWGIAQKLMGGGANYPKLIAANKALIDSWSKKYGAKIPTIYPGMVLTIP